MYQPKIVGFLCNWCSYAGADLAGVSRYNYPPNMRVIRVMCSGRVDPTIIVTAFEEGLDGVFVGGCHPGDCHYLTGNYQTEYKILMLKTILKKIGFDERRLRLEWVSAAEGKRFSEIITSYVEEISNLGPSPVKTDENIAKLLANAKMILADFRLRWLISRERDLVDFQNAYGEKIPKEKFQSTLDIIIGEELMKVKILSLIEKQALSPREISQALKISTRQVMEPLISLSDEHRVSLSIKNNEAVYTREE